MAVSQYSNLIRALRHGRHHETNLERSYCEPRGRLFHVSRLRFKHQCSLIRDVGRWI